jgi:amino acid transporter
MSDHVAGASQTVHDHELKRNALGLPSAMAMSIAFISPTIGVLFITSLIAGKAGLSSPFVFILGTIGIALMASTLAQFTKRVTSAGTFYKFITHSMGSSAGLVAGLLFLLSYSLQSPLNTNLFGGYLSQVLKADFKVTVQWWILMILIVVAVGGLAWYSVHTSMRFDIAFVIAEVTIVGILLVLILFKGGDSGQIPSAFTPKHSSGGGIGEAFVFIVLAFFGFESCSTVAEETKNPRRNLPIALIGSCVAAGLWFTFAMYSILVGYGAKHVGDVSSSSAPLTALAQRYIGHWYGTVVDLAAVSAIIAVLLAIHTANFRVIYSLGRDGALPKFLGRTHAKRRTPTNAIIAYSIFTLIIGLIAGHVWGPIASFGNLGYLSSLAILPIYILTNIALTVFILRKYRSEFNVVLHLIFPILSSATFVVGIWLNLHPWPKSPLSVMPWLIIAWVVASVAWVMVLRRRGQSSLSRLSTVLFMEGEASGRADVAAVLPVPDGVSDAVTDAVAGGVGAEEPH